MGATGKKMSSFLLTHYTDNYFGIYQNNIIKMWEQFRILEFPYIIWFIIIGGIFLISSSNLVYMLSTTAVYTNFLLGGCYNWLFAFVPIKRYSNTETDKEKIIKENKNKSGIYMFENNLNDKRYVGSSDNLKRRFLEYFNENYLLKNKSMAICCALLKHGHSNFSLIILEYCLVAELLIREKHYQKTFKPEYNIAKEPGAPMSGRTHSDETKKIMSDAKQGISGENHPMYGKNHTDESKKIMSDAKQGITGENHPRFGQNHSEETKKQISDALVGNTNSTNQPNSQVIEVTDIKNNTTIYYDSINEAARALNIHHSRIVKYFANNQQKPYKGQYTFKKL